MSTADKLNKLLETKQAIKQAIIDKGVEMEDNTPFAQYPDCIRNIETGGDNPVYEVIYNIKTNNGTNYGNLLTGYQGTELNLNSLDTSNVTDMNHMFYNCANLQTLNISNFNTSNVTNMNNMFDSCNKLTSLDVINFDTSKVTDMGCMFWNCQSLTSIDVSNFNTSNVTSMNYMFSNCSSLEELDLSNFNTNKQENGLIVFSGMFAGCTNLQSLDIRNFDISGTYHDSYSDYYEGCFTDMFANCNNLRELHLDNCSRDTIEWFINPDRTNFPTNDIGETRIIYCKEDNAAGLTAPDGWVFEYVIEDYINSGKPYIEAKFDTQYQGHINGESGHQWKYSFDGINWHNNDDCSYNEEEDIYNGATTEGNETIYFRPNNEQIGEDIGMYRLFENANGLMEAEFHNMENIIVPISPYMDHMFENTRITNVDLSWMNIEEIRNVDFMFSGCSLLETVDIRNLNIVNEGYEGDSESEITDMFAGCDNLRELHLDNCSRDTIEKIINSVGFPIGDIGVTRTIYCKGENLVTALEAPANWEFHYVDNIIPEVPVVPPEGSIPLYVPGEFEYDTIVTEARTMVDESHDDLSYMFNGCSNLVSVNTEDWDTSNVSNMTEMFYNCTSLTQLDLSNFDTSNLSVMSSMFNGCVSLTTLNLSNWDATFAYMPDWDIRDMFLRCDSLHTLHLDNCSNDTISKIINSIGFPTGTIAGVTRTIYCKESEVAGLTAPTNWVFSYVD